MAVGTLERSIGKVDFGRVLGIGIVVYWVIRFRYSIAGIGRVVIEVGGIEIGVYVGLVGRSLLHNNSTPGVVVRGRSGVVLVVCVINYSAGSANLRISERNTNKTACEVFSNM